MTHLVAHASGALVSTTHAPQPRHCHSIRCYRRCAMPGTRIAPHSTCWYLVLRASAHPVWSEANMGH
eukprot:327367-Rhodomonas_salina.1